MSHTWELGDFILIPVMLHFREIFRRWEMQTHKERWSIRQRSFERLRRRQTNRNFLNDGCVSTMCTHFDELCTRRAQRLRFTIVVSPQRSTHNEGVIARTCYRGENSESDESGALNFVHQAYHLIEPSLKLWLNGYTPIISY